MATTGYNLEQTGEQVQAALNRIINLTTATEETDGLMSASDKASLESLNTEINDKVDKVAGKGLSTNDFTDEEKAKTDSAYQKPGSGIPKSDLASGVQSSLDKADAAATKIPAAASSSNQLADKAYVDSEIVRAAADYKGAFDSLADLHATPGTINDYAFVVSTDEAGNTIYSRYEHNGSAWVYRYDLANNEFSATEWASIQSGITSAGVQKLSALPTNADLTTALAGKQATLVSGTNIKTVGGQSLLGSGNVAMDDPDAVKYTAQTPTDAQKAQARTNIGAGTYSKPSSGIPSSDMASAVQTSLGKADTAYQKPGSGIPKTDLASGVQSSLDLADTAVQCRPSGEVNPTITPATYATQEELSQLDLKVDVKSEVVDLLGTASGASGTLNISKYTQYDKVISGSSIWEAAAVPNCYSRIIPVTPGKYKITASSTQSIIAFLSAMPVDNQAVSFGTVNGVQTSSRTSIPSGTTQEYTILDTDTSVYLCVRDDATTVLRPTIVYTANVELFVPLNTEFAVVTDATDNIVELQDAKVAVNGTTVETFYFGRIKITGTATGTGGRTTKLCIPFSLSAGDYRLVTSNSHSATVFIEAQSGDTILAQDSAPTFTLNSATTVYIGVNVVSGTTYSDNFGIAIFSDQSKTEYVPTITAKDLTARKQIANIIAEDSKTGNGVAVNTITPSVTTANKFIGFDGYVASLNGFAYTEKFYVEKGKQIFVTARGYSTNVAMISKVVTENSKYDPVVISTDSLVHDYTYIVNESGYFAASYSTAQPCTISIIANTPASLSKRIDDNDLILANHETRITDNESKLSGASVTTLSLSETANKFIGFDGYVASSNGFAYTEKFYVEKGKQIIVKARGYSTNVAMISKVVTENSKYDPVVISTDSLVHDYTYLVNESGYFAASYSTAQTHSVVVAENTPTVLSERIDQLSNGMDDISKDLYFGIPTIGIIGDSLASGVGYNPNTNSVQEYINYAWWKVMERRSGRTFRRFCEGGMSTRSFITNAIYGLPVALTSGKECKLYIFALEVNDRSSLGPSYLGTVSDIDLNDPDNNADTYYGNYARIIQKITAFNPGCKFMLFTNPRTDGDFNDAIRTIAGMFSNCYLVDLWELYSEYYTSGGFFDQFKDQTAHYPGMAYQAMAKLLEKAIDNCISDNKSAFDEIQY